MVACLNPARAKIFISFSYFLEFSFYYNMRLIQFNVYFNHHFQIIMLSYITRYLQFRSWPPIRTYVSANNISFFRKLFSGAKFAFHIVFLYLELFRFSFKVDNTRQYLKIQYIWPLQGSHWRVGDCPILYIFRKLFLWAIFSLQIVCLCLEPLKRYKASHLTMLKIC